MSFAAKMFSRIDADGGGSISKAEWGALFKSFDKDGSNSVDLGEFVSGFMSAFGSNEEQAKRAFAKLDDDKSGEITVQEITDFFKEMDKDGSGEIDRDEFLAVWSKVF